MSNKISNSAHWCNYDFEVNKYHWINKGMSKALPYRIENLIALARVLDDFNIPFWLQGNTLKGAVRGNSLLDDHDDDIGMDSKYEALLSTAVLERLSLQGFYLIRQNTEIISFIRNDRYIDVCLFKSKGNKYGYSSKWFPRKHFVGLDDLMFIGRKFLIPNHADELLKIMYSPQPKQKLFEFFSKLGQPSKYLNFLRRATLKCLNKLPHHARIVFSMFFSFTGISYKKIFKDEFQSLLIEDVDSFNWKWRKPHLDIVTDNKSNIKIGDILQNIKNKNGIEILVSKVLETDTSYVFNDPHNYDPRFWQSGNNYFIYNIKYQFRKGVLEYHYANDYINDGRQPLLYTADYYSSLVEMTEVEIKSLLKKSPIEITNGAVTSGKHRVCAMVGRVLVDKSYIPFWAIIK